MEPNADERPAGGLDRDPRKRKQNATGACRRADSLDSLIRVNIPENLRFRPETPCIRMQDTDNGAHANRCLDPHMGAA